MALPVPSGEDDRGRCERRERTPRRSRERSDERAREVKSPRRSRGRSPERRNAGRVSGGMEPKEELQERNQRFYSRMRQGLAHPGPAGSAEPGTREVKEEVTLPVKKRKHARHKRESSSSDNSVKRELKLKEEELEVKPRGTVKLDIAAGKGGPDTAVRTKREKNSRSRSRRARRSSKEVRMTSDEYFDATKRGSEFARSVRPKTPERKRNVLPVAGSPKTDLDRDLDKALREIHEKQVRYKLKISRKEGS